MITDGTMKVVQRGIMKVVPGKMAEAMKLLEEWKAILSRVEGAPTFRGYRRLSGHGDIMHTLVLEGEWDSFTAMATAFDKMFADPEWKKHMVKWDTILESHELEMYTPLPLY